MVLRKDYRISEELRESLAINSQTSVPNKDRRTMAGDAVNNKNGVQVLTSVPNSKANLHVVNARQNSASRKLSQSELWILERRRKCVRAGIIYGLENFLVIWCPLRQIKPHIVLNVCGYIDLNVEIRNIWIPRKESSQKVCWEGALAIFKMGMNASLAASRLMKLSKELFALTFDSYINLLIEAEILYPKVGKPATRIQICGQQSFDPVNMCNIEMVLRRLGTVENIKFRKGVKEYGIICEVDYTYATHAMAAKIAISGIYSNPEGYLSVKIVMTRKIKQIIKHCEDQLEQRWYKVNG